LLNDPYLLILGVIASISFVLYIHEYALRKKFEKRTDKVLEEYREKGLETLHESIKKSNDIIGSSEIEGLKVVSESKQAISKLETDYQEKLEEIIKTSESSITKAQSGLIEFMEDLKKR